TPFVRFFGLGPRRIESNQSNFTGRNFLLDAAFGWYFMDHLRVEMAPKFHTTDILNRAIDDIDDTLTRYGALPNVVDSTNFIDEFALVFDNRKDKEYSTSGSKVRLSYFFSNKALGSDKNFQGWRLEAVQLIPLVKNRWMTALRFNFQEVFGTNTPFYEMSSLGGADEFRAFVPGRFVDKGKIVFQIEQRIKALDWRLFGIPFEIHTDPFFEVGRVFDAVSHLGFNNWQPIGGVGFRLFVPPNIIGRLDVAGGSDGVEIYTELGYPF
ncbi:MAG: BamA/TamA family outer membrane protein, partial [Deltaproteobacteria bacterium]|nr:BamA/TamA family outer membrane protein [Deltaproteobacteria bacterium]